MPTLGAKVTCLKCLAATKKYDFCFHNPNPTPRMPEEAFKKELTQRGLN